MRLVVIFVEARENESMRDPNMDVVEVIGPPELINLESNYFQEI